MILAPASLSDAMFLAVLTPVLRLRMKSEPKYSRTMEIILKSTLQIKKNFGKILCNRLGNIMYHVGIEMMKLIFTL